MLKRGSAEGCRPSAGSLGVSPRYNFPLPGQEGGKGGWSKGFFRSLLERHPSEKKTSHSTAIYL